MTIVIAQYITARNCHRSLDRKAPDAFEAAFARLLGELKADADR
jgi:hypothetical protein